MTALSSVVAKVVDLLVTKDYDVVAVTDADPPAYSVVVDLWTDEVASDLSLELRLAEAGASGYDVEVVDLRVL